MRTSQSLIALVSVLTVTSACGATDGASTDADPSTSPTSSTASSPTMSSPTASTPADPRAAAALRKAVRTMDAEAGLHFSQVIDFGPEISATTTGWSHRGTQSWQAEMTYDVPEDSGLTTSVRSVAGTAWMQMKDWPAPRTGCWLEIRPEEMPAEVGLVSFDSPSALVVLSQLQADRYDDENPAVVHASISGVAAASLLPGRTRTYTNAAEARQSAPRVPVEVTLGDGRVTQVRVVEGDLASIAADDVEQEVQRLFDVMAVTVDYPLIDPRPVRRPPAGSIMSASEMEAQRGCRDAAPDES